jgi:hypothetical protein
MQEVVAASLWHMHTRVIASRAEHIWGISASIISTCSTWKTKKVMSHNHRGAKIKVAHDLTLSSPLPHSLITF